MQQNDSLADGAGSAGGADAIGRGGGGITTDAATTTVWLSENGHGDVLINPDPRVYTEEVKDPAGFAKSAIYLMSVSS